MSSTVTGKGVPVKAPSRASRSSALRFVRMAVAFVVVAGSLGLATVTATAQNGGSSCPSDGAAAYSDVPETSFAYDDSRCLRELGISDAGDTYRPGDDMTRSEMAAFMANAYAVLTGMEAPIEEHMFEDIEDDPNADDIARISPNGLGITQGTTDTTYSPGDPVIRGHMALFLTRLYAAASGGDAPAGETEFTDIGDLSDEEQAAIGQIFALGITTGTTSTTYSPTDNVTRAHMASFVARMYRAINDALADAPAAPTGVEVAVSGDDGDALDVSWDASDGADSYVVQWKSGEDDYSADNQRSVDDGTSTSFDDLTQGTTYTFRVAAVGDAGQGGWSDEASASPAVAPGMVGDLKSTPGNGSLTLSWSAPEDDGGSEITGYVVSWRTGRQATADTADVAGDATEHTITGLDNSKSYSVWVAAMNAAGTGEAALVPAGTDNKDVSPTPTAASAPQNLTVTAGDMLLDLSWTAPADDGGTVLIDYTRGHRCGTTTTWTETPVPHVATSQLQTSRISGLNNGVACEVQVRANSYDDVDDSRDQATDGTEDTKNGAWAEGSGTPATVPGDPVFTAANVTRAHQSLQITWQAPASDGGSDITGYKISWSAGVPAETTVPAEPLMYTITGLSNSYRYSITIKAINDVGESENGATVAATAEVSGEPATQPRAVPAAPTNVQAAPPPVVAGESHDGTALVVTWDAPPANGTNAVTGYTVEHRTSAVLDDDGMVTKAAGIWTGTTSVAAPTTTHTFTSLTSGTAYDVRVRALNDHDDDTNTDPEGGPYGQGSGTPATVPSAVPTMVSVPGYTSLDVSWGETQSGGSEITHYLVRIAANVTGNEPYSADVRVDAPLTRVRLTGLAVGVPHTVQIQAVNGIGTGLNADFGGTTASPDATFRTGLVPEAPTSVTAAPKTDGDGSMLTVTWSSVTRTNGAGPVTSYVVEVRDVTGTAWSPTAVSDATATMFDVSTGVTKGKTYMVRVRAVTSTSAAGSWGYIAEPVTAAGVPDAPQNVMADVDSTTTSTVNVTWNSVPEAELDGTDITGYVVSWYETANPVSGSRGSVSVSGAGTGTYAITGLAPGTYTISVVAVNHVGKSLVSSPATAPTVPEPS